jgi:hypothetical protein
MDLLQDLLSQTRTKEEPSPGATAIPHAVLEDASYGSVSTGSGSPAESKVPWEALDNTDSDASDAENDEESDGPRVGKTYQAIVPALRSCTGA